MKRVTNTGIASVVHGNTGVTPACKRLKFSDVENVVQFLVNYAENNSLILPGRIATNNQKDYQKLKPLPSSVTKRGLHACYKTSCGEERYAVSESTFRHIWKTTQPNIVIQRPRSDLCLECQQSTVKISSMVNLDEDTKEELITKSMQHLELSFS